MRASWKTNSTDSTDSILNPPLPPPLTALAPTTPTAPQFERPTGSGTKGCHHEHYRPPHRRRESTLPAHSCGFLQQFILICSSIAKLCFGILDLKTFACFLTVSSYHTKTFPENPYYNTTAFRHAGHLADGPRPRGHLGKDYFQPLRARYRPARPIQRER